MKKRQLFWPGMMVLICVLGIFFLNKDTIVNAEGNPMYPQLHKFTDCLNQIQKNYVDPVTPEKLIDGAIKGMTSALDPHSTYLTKDQLEEMMVQIKGSFSGLGMEIALREGILTVVSPIEGTPAFKAEIQPGDMILKIEKKSTMDMPLEEAVKLLRGPKGSKVTITILRGQKNKPFEVTLTRDTIHIQSVKSMMLEPGYGYIRVKQFQKDAQDNIKKALEEMRPDLKALILDLRYNPGGLLEQAIDISDLFLSEGKIVQTKGRKDEDNNEYFAHKDDTFEGFQMLVLINGGSASASEIVAGALQDNKRAVILGTKSFGKASVQKIFDMPDKSGIKLTVARYFTPSGRSIQANGITPDIVVEQMLPAENDGNGLTFRREKDLKQHLEPTENTDADVPEDPVLLTDSDNIERTDKVTEMLKKDYQLKYALDLLKSWQVFNKKQ